MQTTYNQQLPETLIELLSNVQLQVKQGALSAILQASSQQNAKKQFLNKNILPILKNFLTQPILRRLSMITLIHFSACTSFIEANIESYTENYSQLIPVLLSQLIPQAEEQFSLMVILNATKHEPIAKIFIDNSIQRLQMKLNALPKNLIERINNKEEDVIKTTRLLLGIVINVLALIDGRSRIIKTKVHVLALNLLDCYNPHVRINALKVLRNCAFQWENQQLIAIMLNKEDDLVEKILKFVAIILNKNKPTEESKAIALVYMKGDQITLKKHMKGIVTEELKEVEIAIEVILILSNCDFTTKDLKIDNQTFKRLLSLLKFSDISEETKDKLQALEIFCM